MRKYFIFKGKKLSYLDLNSNKDKTIIFTHANGYSAECSNYYFNRISDKFRIIALDFSGHGESEPIYEFNDWYIYRDQIVELINVEKLNSAIGIGHSMGAASLLTASKLLPDFFKKLILFDPTVLSIPMMFLGLVFGVPISKNAEKRRRVFKNREHIKKIFRKFPAFSNWNEEAYNDYIRSCIRDIPSGEVELVCDPKLEAKNFRSPSFFSPFRYYKIKTESHIVIPEVYEVCSPKMGKRIISGNKLSTLTIMPEFTHLFPFEKPEWVLNKIQSHLEIS
jgi:pimeloyl-ACP methyl ester carboxylesterase